MDTSKAVELSRLAGEASAEGRHEKAVDLLAEAVEISPESAGLLYNLALEYSALGMTESAKTELKRAMELNPEDGDIAAELGRLEITDMRLGAAAAVLDAALTTNPKHPALLNNRGVAAFLKENYSRSLEFFNRAVEADPDSADAWFNLADAAAETGDMALASKARKQYKALK